MGLKAPEFSPSDNPASDSDSLLTRTLTFWHLPFLNILLLLLPQNLNFDWSMGAVRLIESVFDVRNLSTVTLYAMLGAALYRLTRSLNSVAVGAVEKKPPPHQRNGNHFVRNSFVSTDDNDDDEKQHAHKSNHQAETFVNNHFQSKSGFRSSHSRNGTNHDFDQVDHLPTQSPFASNGFKRPTPSSSSSQVLADDERSNAKILLLSLCLLVFPFVPATNLFFYVGFVIAERVLYLPSMGYSLLVAQGAEILYVRWRHRTWKKVAVSFVSVWLLVTYGLRTVTRNLDWKSEESLYRSGIAINPAKGLI